MRKILQDVQIEVHVSPYIAPGGKNPIAPILLISVVTAMIGIWGSSIAGQWGEFAINQIGLGEASLGIIDWEKKYLHPRLD